MHRNPARDSDAKCADFIGSKPDAGCFFISRRFDAKVVERFNDAILEPPHIAVQSESKCVEVKNWIHDELPRAVVGNVAASVGVMDLNARRIEYLGCGQQVRPGGGPPRDRNDWGCVLNK